MLHRAELSAGKRIDGSSTVCRKSSRALAWWTAATVLICAGAWRVRERGRIAWRIPPTVMSASGSNPALAEAVLLFLQAAGSRIPARATTAVVWIGHANPHDETITLATAVGQLPDQRVIPAVVRDGRIVAESPPSFVAAVGGELMDGRYEIAERLGIGAIYRRIR